MIGVTDPYAPIFRVHGNIPQFEKGRWCYSHEFSAVRCKFYGLGMQIICSPSAFSARPRAISGIDVDICWLMKPAQTQVMGSRWSTRIISVQFCIRAEQNNHFIIVLVRNPHSTRWCYGDCADKFRKSGHLDKL